MMYADGLATSSHTHAHAFSPAGTPPEHLRTRVYVGNIPWSMSDQDVAAVFGGSIGPVREAKVVLDRDTGRSKGFCFVTFETEEAARIAIERWNGSQLGGRTIKIGQAQPPSSSTPSSTLPTLTPPSALSLIPPSHPGHMHAHAHTHTHGHAYPGPQPQMYRGAPQYGAPASYSYPGEYGYYSEGPPVPPAHMRGPAPPHGFAPRPRPEASYAYAGAQPAHMGRPPLHRGPAVEEPPYPVKYASGRPVPPADLAGFSHHSSARLGLDAGDPMGAMFYPEHAGVDTTAPLSASTLFADGGSVKADPSPESVESLATSVAQLALSRGSVSSAAEGLALWPSSRASQPLPEPFSDDHSLALPSASARGPRTLPSAGLQVVHSGPYPGLAPPEHHAGGHFMRA